MLNHTLEVVLHVTVYQGKTIYLSKDNFVLNNLVMLGLYLHAF